MAGQRAWQRQPRECRGAGPECTGGDQCGCGDESLRIQHTHADRSQAQALFVCRRQWLDSVHGSASREGAEMLAQNAQEEASAAVEMSVRRVGALDNLQCLDDNLDASPSRSVLLSVRVWWFLLISGH